MPSTKRTVEFLESEDGIAAKVALRKMMEDAAFDTTSTYTSNGTDYPDNQISFVDKHMAYMCAHPEMDTGQYISNLRLRSRVR